MLRFSEEEFKAFIDRKKTGKTPTRKVTPAPIELSPHAKALAYFAKNPDKAAGNHEHISQCQIFDFYERNDPYIYSFLLATPNGGLRAKTTAFKMLAEGLKKGYPDISLEIPKGAYHGLRLELKREGGSGPTPEQIDWLNRLSRQGFYCVLCFGSDQAIKAINAYMTLSEGEYIEHSLNDKAWKSLNHS